MIISEPCAYTERWGVSPDGAYGIPRPADFFGFHTGRDVPMFVGATVAAVRSGVVSAAWPAVLPPTDPNFPQGICAIVDCGDGTRWWYAHLSRLDVSVGQSLAYGQVIGLSGMTGAATGPHLHLEKNIRVATPDGPVWPGNWKPVDPEEDLMADYVTKSELAAYQKDVRDTLDAMKAQYDPVAAKYPTHKHDEGETGVPIQ